jgi:hypothetical protein
MVIVSMKISTTNSMIKQWDLPNGSTVELPDERTVTFLKMDGMYAKWDDGGAIATGNFMEFEKVGNNLYRVIK